MAILGLPAFFSPPESRSRSRAHLVSRSRRKVVPIVRAEVRYVSGEEAKKLVEEEGYVVLDVRDGKQYGQSHIKSSRHIPLFVENNDNDFGTIVKKTLHNNFVGLFFGLPFTKLNPDFVQEAKRQFTGDTRLVVVCQEGLRSAAAATMLEKEGFQNLSCITSGLRSVKLGTFESVGAVDLQDAGKGGLVSIQGKISLVLGTLLISAYLFITFFPEQAEKILQLSPAS
ncbi:hypothetical protein HPP92_002607 [Vanilla planifolia]|uniref:Rhodanese domain-containing protein n=1 Tax=Vanilla planifolia TaxID=51239 RepID=A0A835VII9_VANPL|nr:hypothetical protein HPP92_003001 [Vanilla planifolia]KAG0502535.1 hypothetical protein HPP92_002607 [Vanilla planifolia]